MQLLTWKLLSRRQRTIGTREDLAKHALRNVAILECSGNRKVRKTISLAVFAAVVTLGASCQTLAQNAKTPYPRMASLDQYLMERNAEIALARSAAPDSISQDADVVVLGRQGYESAVKGKNGFVCVVQRSWTAGVEDPDFWNPKLRAPICYNPPAARSYLPIVFKKTELVLAGMSKEQMFERIKTSFDKKELVAPETGSMCYMMSIHGYLGDAYGHWHSHLMFFVPQTDSTAWGAGLPGSPVIVAQDPEDRLTVFMILVSKWSDGTASPQM